MMTTDPDFPAALLASARSWEGTPFRQLHAERGIGIDCANLTYAVLRDAGIAVPDLGAPTFGKSADVPFGTVIGEFLADLVAAGTIVPVDDVTAPEIQPGDVLLYQISRRIQHVALALDAQTQIHAWPERRAAIVAFDAGWRRKLKTHYRLTNG